MLDQNLSHYLSLFQTAAIIINIHLHKANIFVHSCVNIIKNFKFRTEKINLRLKQGFAVEIMGLIVIK